MAIAPTDLGGDADVARQVLALARSIAPCIQSLPDGDDRDSAISILKAVAGVGQARGSQLVKSQAIGPARVEYVDGSWFSADHRAALRVLCSAVETQPAGHPEGSFPPVSKIVSRMWPEDAC